MDEVHFQQHGSRCRMWIPPEIKDPVLLHHPTRKSVGYFGAVSIKDGSFVYLQEKDKFNAQSFYEFLKQLEEITAARGSKAILITDNARYHHAVLHKEWRKSVSEHFELAFLPPYSPELNPIERVWKLVRYLCLHNQYFPEMNILIEDVECQFEKWVLSNEILKRLCAI